MRGFFAEFTLSEIPGSFATLRMTSERAQNDNLVRGFFVEFTLSEIPGSFAEFTLSEANGLRMTSERAQNDNLRRRVARTGGTGPRVRP